MRVAIPWGSFGLDGSWQHNPMLKMSADEQRRLNVLNGYLPSPEIGDGNVTKPPGELALARTLMPFLGTNDTNQNPRKSLIYGGFLFSRTKKFGDVGAEIP